MPERIAVVQHGDYLVALRAIGRGEPEPYFGMSYSLRVLDHLFGRSPYLVISLNAPGYREPRGQGELVGLPMPGLPAPIPRSLAMLLWASRITRELARFAPTRVLVRTPGILAWRVLAYCARREIDTLVIFANLFDEPDFRTRLVNREIVRLLNRPFVFLVGNHKRPATETMLERGVDPRKVVAWDWPGQRDPSDLPPKSLSAGDCRIVYVGAMTEDKGVGDLIDAVKLLHEAGIPVRLIAVGTGPDLPRMRVRAASLPPGVVTFPGRIGNAEAVRLMVDSTFVCVPSRHEFTEGMPMTLTEALASRTPTVASDHPVISKAFVDGQGLRLFPARDSRALAAVIRALLDDPAEYARLSRSTEQAFRRVECKTFFGELLDRWKGNFAEG